MNRLLLLSASAGAGHNRAAEAVHEWAREASPGTQSEWVDSLKYTNRLFSKVYEKSYFWMASYAPDLWGAVYKQLGKKRGPGPTTFIVAFSRNTETPRALMSGDSRPAVRSGR